MILTFLHIESRLQYWVFMEKKYKLAEFHRHFHGTSRVGSFNCGNSAASTIDLKISRQSSQDLLNVTEPQKNWIKLKFRKVWAFWTKSFTYFFTNFAIKKLFVQVLGQIEGHIVVKQCNKFHQSILFEVIFHTVLRKTYSKFKPSVVRL